MEPETTPVLLILLSLLVIIIAYIDKKRVMKTHNLWPKDKTNWGWMKYAFHDFTMGLFILVLIWASIGLIFMIINR